MLTLEGSYLAQPPDIRHQSMVGFVSQSGAVLAEVTVLRRNKHTDVKLPPRVDHVGEIQAVLIPLVLILLPLQSSVKGRPGGPEDAVQDEAAEEADQVSRPHPPPQEQSLARPLDRARPDIHRALLKRVSQVGRDSKAVKVWRTVGNQSITESAGL